MTSMSFPGLSSEQNPYWQLSPTLGFTTDEEKKNFVSYVNFQYGQAIFAPHYPSSLMFPDWADQVPPRFDQKRLKAKFKKPPPKIMSPYAQSYIDTNPSIKTIVETVN